LEEYIYIKHKNTGTKIGVSREVGLGVNTEKTMYMVVFFHQTIGQNHDVLIVHKFFENW